MTIEQTDSYTILRPLDENSGKSLITISDFFKEFSDNYTKFKNENLILDFSKNINTDLKEILLFSQLSEVHKNNDKSFVIVCNGIDFDDLPNKLIAVPTFKEAEDVIEIEEIERDLGI
ncbi:MAG: ribonuclease Z [Flavobacteriaceae bacterium]|nr:ribonuclease Z [Flavobacteriaceae bacterium]